jgi:hypothetical protein
MSIAGDLFHVKTMVAADSSHLQAFSQQSSALCSLSMPWNGLLAIGKSKIKKHLTDRASIRLKIVLVA